MDRKHGREHDDPRLMRWIDRPASRRTSAAVEVSQRSTCDLDGDGGVARRTIRIIHSGVDTDVLGLGPASAESRSPLGVPPNALVIGRLGRLDTVQA